MGKGHKPDEIIGKLREAQIELAQGGTVAMPAVILGHRDRRQAGTRGFLVQGEPGYSHCQRTHRFGVVGAPGWMRASRGKIIGDVS